MRVPIEERAEGLNRRDRPRHEVALSEGDGQEVSQDLVSGSAQAREQSPVVEEVRSKSLRESEHVLTVGNVVEELLTKPVAPKEEPLCVAGRTEVSTLAAEGDEKLRATVFADHAREAVFEDPAVQKLPHDFADASVQRSVEGLELLLVHLEETLVVILEDPVERRGLGTPGAVEGSPTHDGARASDFVPPHRMRHGRRFPPPGHRPRSGERPGRLVPVYWPAHADRGTNWS
jgi:hypothetical protein